MKRWLSEIILIWLEMDGKAFILALLGIGDRACQNQFEQDNMSVWVKWEELNVIKTWDTSGGKWGWRVCLRKDYEKPCRLMGIHDH